MRSIESEVIILKAPNVPLHNLHEYIKHANDGEMDDLVKRQAADLLDHSRTCSPCDAKRKQALERALANMPPERRKRLSKTAQSLAREL